MDEITNQFLNLSVIFDGLAMNKSVKKLSIRFTGRFFVNKIGINQIDMKNYKEVEDKSIRLCNALKNFFDQNQSMNTLELINLKFGGKLIRAIGNGLINNQSLVTLKLPGNLIVIHILIQTWEDLSYIFEGLKSNKTIESIDIKDNKINRIEEIPPSERDKTIKNLKEIFTLYILLKDRIKFEINKWIFVPSEYPDDALHYMKELRLFSKPNGNIGDTTDKSIVINNK